MKPDNRKTGLITRLGWRLAGTFTFVMCVLLISAGLAGSGDKGGKIIYAELILPDTYNPLTTTDNETALRLSELIFESLVYIDHRGDVKGRLAEKWKVFEGNKRIVFTLRKGVKWHDGKPFTADDVKFTYDAIMNPLSDVPSERRKALQVIKSVKVLSPNVIKFDFISSVPEPEKRFLFKILPRHALGGKSVLSKLSKFAKDPVGTGYYKFIRETKNKDIILEGFTDHYMGTPNIPDITMRYQPEVSLLVQSLILNAIDLMIEVPPQKITEIANTGKFTILPYNSLTFAFFGFNFNNPVLRIKEVRQAISFALDRQKMLDDIYFSRGEIISGPFSPASWGYNPDVAPRSYNLKKAKKLIAKAGLKDTDKDGIVEYNGRPVKLKLKIPLYSGNEGGLSVCLRFQNHLKNIGLGVVLEHREIVKWKKEVKDKHDFDIVFAEWLFDNSSNIYSLFHSSESKPMGDNFISYKNKRVDSLLTVFSETINQEVRRRINYELHTILNEEVPYCFLWTLEKNSAIDNKVKKFIVQPYRFFTFANEWYIPKKERE
ncbi:ABC transporter substrate-binding protein [Fibrobacterota bacterium]